jgi:hypothetical protein
MEKLLVAKYRNNGEITVDAVEEMRVVVKGADNWYAIYTDSARVYIRTGQDSCSEQSMCYSPLPSVGDKLEVGQFNMYCVVAEHADYNVDSTLTLQDGMLHLEESKGWDLCPCVSFPEVDKNGEEVVLQETNEDGCTFEYVPYCDGYIYPSDLEVLYPYSKSHEGWDSLWETFEVIAVYEDMIQILNHISEYKEITYADGRETRTSGDKTPIISLVEWEKGCLGFIFRYEKFGEETVEVKIPIEYFDIE